eukprot:jgi/Ulvmu1/11153/UM071_0037.1
MASSSSGSPPQTGLSVALIGSGHYAPAYISALRQVPLPVRIKYVWSRADHDSAEGLRQQAADLCTADAETATGPEGWETILADPEVAAVLVVLPTCVAPEYALQAVEAGKAALSEKPIADSMHSAHAYMQRYAALPSPAPWLVGENWRFLPVFADAAAVVGARLGRVSKMDLLCDIPLANSKYTTSKWRKALSGGFMLDSGVHQIAVLRMLADAAGAGAPLRASATASYHAQRGLSNPDTLVGSVEWESGLRTGVSITLVAAYTRWSLSASGESGTVEVSRGAWNGRGENMRHELCYRTTAADEMVCRQYSIDSMERELEAFLRAAATWRSGAQHDPALAAEVAKGSPGEALLDLAILEALIEASRTGVTVPVAGAAAA